MKFETPKMELLIELLDEVTMALGSVEVEETEEDGGYSPMIPL